MQLVGHDVIDTDPQTVVKVLKSGLWDSLSVPQAYMGIDVIHKVKGGKDEGRVQW